MQTSFKTGDKAVYPGQGVGEVMGIEHTEVAGQRQSFYVLRILENGMRIMIPINKVGSVGLREEDARSRGMAIAVGIKETPSTARGWIHGPGNDGKPSTKKRRLGFEDEELKLIGPDATQTPGKLNAQPARPLVRVELE